MLYHKPKIHKFGRWVMMYCSRFLLTNDVRELCAQNWYFFGQVWYKSGPRLLWSSLMVSHEQESTPAPAAQPDAAPRPMVAPEQRPWFCESIQFGLWTGVCLAIFLIVMNYTVVPTKQPEAPDNSAPASQKALYMGQWRHDVSYEPDSIVLDNNILFTNRHPLEPQRLVNQRGKPHVSDGKLNQKPLANLMHQHLDEVCGDTDRELCETNNAALVKMMKVLGAGRRPDAYVWYRIDAENSGATCE